MGINGMNNLDINKNSSLKLQQTNNFNSLNKPNENSKEKNLQNNLQDNLKDNGYDEKTDKLLKQVNDKFKIFNREFDYAIHEKTNRYIVTVKDSETGETIKEIPSEKALDLFAKMLEMSGLLIDEKS